MCGGTAVLAGSADLLPFHPHPCTVVHQLPARRFSPRKPAGLRHGVPHRRRVSHRSAVQLFLPAIAVKHLCGSGPTPAWACKRVARPRILEYERNQVHSAAGGAPEARMVRSAPLVRRRSACRMDIGCAIPFGPPLASPSIHCRARSAEDRVADSQKAISKTLRVRTACAHLARTPARRGGG